MRLVFFGSGAFGLPTLRRLITEHDVVLAVTQPDRPAGRNRTLTSTPVAEHASKCGIHIIKPEQVNDSKVIAEILRLKADAFVVIAFGQKLGPGLLKDTFAINLHASLLPRYRGAAPIQWAMMDGERETGVSVIGLADRMDAGPIYGQAATLIDPMETAGELHDRLAEIGPDAILDVLQKHAAGRLISQEQDERMASRAPKLTKADGTVWFDQPADRVARRVHGLTPWPGCTVRVEGKALRLARVQVVDENTQHSLAGLILEDGSIACSPGAIRLLAVQPPGGKMMSFEAYRAGHRTLPGMKMEPL